MPGRLVEAHRNNVLEEPESSRPDRLREPPNPDEFMLLAMQRQSARSSLLNWKTTAFAAFLMAGAFKADDRLAAIPFDLTLLLAGVTLVALILEIPRTHWPRSTLLPITLFGAFALGIPFAPDTTYAVEKIAGLFLLTFLATIAPFSIVRTAQQQRQFLNALVLLGVIMAVDLLVALGNGALGIGNRFAGFSGSPIVSSRIAGTALLVILISHLYSRRHNPALLFIVSAGLGTAVAASGSRGTVIALAAAIAWLVAYAWRRAPAMKRNLSAVAAIGGLSVLSASLLVPQSVVDRFDLRNADQTSIEGRLDLYDAALEGIVENPLGVGWGGFFTTSPGLPEEIWPHNLVIEVFLEGGWIAGAFLAFVAYRVWALARQWPESEMSLVYSSVLIYLATASLFSTDINGNRLVFAIAGVVLAGAGIPARTNQTPQDWLSRWR